MKEAIINRIANRVIQNTIAKYQRISDYRQGILPDQRRNQRITLNVDEILRNAENRAVYVAEFSVLPSLHRIS